MSKQQLDRVNDLWSLQMENDEYGPFFIYEPFSDSYWSEEVKIAICNLESYDETSDENSVLDLTTFRSWLNYRRGRTPRYSVLLIAAIRAAIISGIHYGRKDYKNKFMDTEFLIDEASRSIYMNLRMQKGRQVEEDSHAINKFLHPSYGANEHNRKNLVDFIEALESDVFIVSGKTGADILSRIYSERMSLIYKGLQVVDGRIFVSIEHPRVLSYARMSEVVTAVVEARRQI